MEEQNRTAQDARERVMGASTGSLVNASDEFLFTLRAELHQWLYRIDEEVFKRVATANRIARDKEDEDFEDEEESRHL